MSELPPEFERLSEAGISVDNGQLPGRLFMKGGPSEYVGAVIAAVGVVYFRGAHTRPVQVAISECFDEYRALVGDRLRWLRDVKPDSSSFVQVKPVGELMKKLRDDFGMIYHYHGGERREDASDYDFQVFGHFGWQEAMGTWGYDHLRFALPMEYVKANSISFVKLFVSFCRKLNAIQGHGGYGFVLSGGNSNENEPTEAALFDKMPGLDVGDPSIVGTGLLKAGGGIKKAAWLTAINQDMLKRLDGGLQTLREELPSDWYAYYDYGHGVVIQAGPAPIVAVPDSKPATLVLANMTLKELRAKGLQGFHYGSTAGEPRMGVVSVKEWQEQFDVPEDELVAYKAKLLREPKLKKGTFLPDRL